MYGYTQKIFFFVNSQVDITPKGWLQHILDLTGLAIDDFKIIMMPNIAYYIHYYIIIFFNIYS